MGADADNGRQRMVLMELLALPAFADNYIWLLHDGKDALVVDPGAAEPVQTALAQHGLRLAHLFITHQHHDHIDGVAALITAHQPAVWAARHPQIQAQTAGAMQAVVLDGGESVQALGLDWQVLAAPGHTLSHILLYAAALPLSAGVQPVLFCGDTLFSAGCGRLFEGSPAQMWHTLARINALPGETLICCAHEYTLSNLRFAASVHPACVAVGTRMAQCQQLRDQGLPTLPSNLAQERKFNPFLQALDLKGNLTLTLHLAGFPAEQWDSLSVFAALRTLRNDFS